MWMSKKILALCFYINFQQQQEKKSWQKEVEAIIIIIIIFILMYENSFSGIWKVKLGKYDQNLEFFVFLIFFTSFSFTLKCHFCM